MSDWKTAPRSGNPLHPHPQLDGFIDDLDTVVETSVSDSLRQRYLMERPHLRSLTKRELDDYITEACS